MPQALNDLSSNPWVVAEVGVVTEKNCKIGEIIYHEPDDATAVVEIVNKNGTLLGRFTEEQNRVEHPGWMNGITVERLDSGYLLIYFES